jgi:radical SAM protein with 4Fe4S-binding SPASM domain
VNSVLHRDNLKDVPLILELCQNIGVHGLAFYFFTPVGRGAAMANGIIPPHRWMYTKNKVLVWIKKFSPRFRIYWEEAYESIDKPSLLPWRCEKEHTDTIFVRCDGDVFSCALLEATPCRLGNCTNEQLDSILQRRRQKAFSRSRGCPALAFQKSQNFSRTDPRDHSRTTKLGCPYNYQLLNG